MSVYLIQFDFFLNDANCNYSSQDSFFKQEIFLSNTILKVMNMRITIMYDYCLIIWNT